MANVVALRVGCLKAGIKCDTEGDGVNVFWRLEDKIQPMKNVIDKIRKVPPLFVFKKINCILNY